MLLTTDGIVMKHIKASGGRNMLLIFTKKYGKISVGTGSSIRNNRSKSALAVRPFTLGKYEIFQNRQYYNYNSGEVKRSFFSFGEDLDKYMAASYVLELTDKALPEGVPEPRLFNALEDFMVTLEGRSKKALTLILAYEIKMLDILGTPPVMNRCTCCGSKENLEFFSVGDGGMICRKCAEDKRSETHKYKEGDRPQPLIYKANFDIVNIVEFFLKTPVTAFSNLALIEEDADRLQRIIREYLSFHQNIGKLKSEAILNGI